MDAVIGVCNVWESSRQAITGLSVNSRELSTNNCQRTTGEQGDCKLHVVPSVQSLAVYLLLVFCPKSSRQKGCFLWGMHCMMQSTRVPDLGTSNTATKALKNASTWICQYMKCQSMKMPQVCWTDSSSSMKGALQIQTQWQEVNVNENRDKQWIAEHQS